MLSSILNRWKFLIVFTILLNLSYLYTFEKEPTRCKFDFIKEFIRENYELEPSWEIRVVTTSSIIGSRQSQIFLCFVGEGLSEIFEKERKEIFYFDKEVYIKESITYMGFIFEFDESSKLKYFWGGGNKITGKIQDATWWLKEYEDLSKENVKEKIQSILKIENAKYPMDAREKLKSDLISKKLFRFLGEEKAEIEKIDFDIHYTEKPKTVYFIWKVSVKTFTNYYELLIEPFKGYIIRINIH
jgi:hypothetical protein